jgi:hypothetical protein
MSCTLVKIPDMEYSVATKATFTRLLATVSAAASLPRN